MHSLAGEEYTPRPYSGYKNAKFTKHSDILKNSIRQIKDCSLKEEDKKRLLLLLSEILLAEMDRISKELLTTKHPNQ